MPRPRRQHRNGRKLCTGCGLWLTLRSYGKHTSRWDGLQDMCKQCGAAYQRRWAKDHPEVEVARGKRWAAANPERAKAIGRRETARRYGLTLEEYDTLVARPCEICGGNEDPMHVDHDHATGKVRGALCRSCNWTLGLARDDADRLERAAAYLRRHANQSALA